MLEEKEQELDNAVAESATAETDVKQDALEEKSEAEDQQEAIEETRPKNLKKKPQKTQ